MNRKQKAAAASLPIDGGSGALSRSVRKIAEYLAFLVDKDHGTRNGKTALYWHLIGTCAGHASRPEPAEAPPVAAVSQEWEV